MRLFKTKIEYVPVGLSDTRSRMEKWTDRRYLADLDSIGDNSVYLSEVLRELTGMRDIADTAKTPEYLAGCSVGIAALKRLLTVSQRAKAQIKRIDDKKELEFDGAE